MDRRIFVTLACGAALCAAGRSALAQPTPSAKPVDVVKIMSFGCSFCYAAEAHDRMITTAATKTGGRFVRAAIPAEDGATGWRERTYFAARDLDPAFGDAVKQSIYRGVQESDITLNDLTQLYYWFLQDIPAYEARFNKLFELAQAPAAQEALMRAVRLVKNSGASQLPTYVLLVDGAIQATLDSSNSRGTSLAALRDDVLAQVEKLSNRKT